MVIVIIEEADAMMIGEADAMIHTASANPTVVIRTDLIITADVTTTVIVDATTAQGTMVDLVIPTAVVVNPGIRVIVTSRSGESANG